MQALFIAIPHWKYNRPSGTRWVEHQVASINSHNHNLPIYIGFLNISRNQDYKLGLSVEHLQRWSNSFRRCEVRRIKCCATSEQENSLIVPSVVTSCAKTLKSIGKLNRLLVNDGANAFMNQPWCFFIRLIHLMKIETEEITPGRQTRNDARQSPENSSTWFTRVLIC